MKTSVIYLLTKKSKKIFLVFVVCTSFMSIRAQDLLLGQSSWGWDTATTAFRGYDSVENTYNSVNNKLWISLKRTYSGGWNYSAKTTHEYDGQNQDTAQTDYNWVASAWQYSYKRRLTYDGSGNRTQELDMKYMGGALQNYMRDDYTYIGTQLFSDYHYVWVGSVWSNYGKTIYHYNSQNSQDTMTYTFWNSGTNNWDLIDRHIYLYDSLGRFSADLKQTWNSSTLLWANSTDYTYTYNSAGKITQYVIYNWNGIFWDSNSKWEYTYYNNLYLTKTEYSVWLSAFFTWSLQSRTVSMLDGNNLATYDVRQDYSTAISALANYDSSTHEYDAHGNLVHTVGHGWVNYLNDWRNRTDQYWWYLLGSTGIEEIFTAPVKVYPNPSSDVLNIQFNTTGPEIISASLFDESGRLSKIICRRLEAPGMVNIEGNISELSSGVYFLQIAVGEKSKTEKIIITH